MQGYRMDPMLKPNENVNKLLGSEEKILHTFDVVPLDYRIVDYSTPKFYITNLRLIFSFDEGIEVYNLDTLDVERIGSEPEFSMQSLILTQNKLYTASENSELQKLKLDENLCRLSITEPKQVPKYFLAREGIIISKSYKTWALTQIINNVKIGNYNNAHLVEMMNGYFSAFNQRTMLYFIFAFLIYIVLKIISGLLLPQLVGTILDVVFGIIVIFIGYWLWVSVDRNLKKYERNYHTYSKVN